MGRVDSPKTENQDSRVLSLTLLTAKKRKTTLRTPTTLRVCILFVGNKLNIPIYDIIVDYAAFGRDDFTTLLWTIL
jgi:hypothetical protein